MIVRGMIKEDIPQLAQLYKQFWGEESSIDTMYMQFKKFQENGSHILLSAVEDNQLVGSVMGVICEELYGDCKSFLVLENMIVDKDHRNRGIGRALISELEKRAVEKCNQIILVTEANRIDACNFYESVGYRPEVYKGFKKKQVGEKMENELILSEQLFRLEDRLLQPEVRQSKEEIAELLADDFVEFGSSGRIFDKTQVLEGLPHSPIIQMTIENFQMKCLSKNVALVTYRVVKTNEPREGMRYSLRSSIWKLIAGRWQMIFHQGTRIPEF